ncbi:hypothetical protein QTP88_013331 [Uroleucon formosanum]
MISGSVFFVICYWVGRSFGCLLDGLDLKKRKEPYSSLDRMSDVCICLRDIEFAPQEVYGYMMEEFFAGHQMFRSSAKRVDFTGNLIFSLRSFMATRNKVSERVEPCGTPFS